MSLFEFKLPDIGEGVMEGEIVKWLVQPGDAVREDQPLVEVMTDKATVTIGAPEAGVVKELRGQVGDTVPVGQVIVRQQHLCRVQPILLEAGFVGLHQTHLPDRRGCL